MLRLHDMYAKPEYLELVFLDDADREYILRLVDNAAIDEFIDKLQRLNMLNMSLDDLRFRPEETTRPEYLC